MAGSEDRGVRFRHRLEKRLAELLELRETSAGSRDVVALDQQSVGRLSRMDAMQAQQMALAGDRRRQAEISRIRRALKDIDEGDFGYCAACGGAISDGRLEADPTVHLCIACAASKTS